MGRKADKRTARLAAALEREWWVTAAQAWVYVGEAIRWQTDPVYRAEVRAERAQSNPLILRVNRAIREAWEEPPKVKPRSKRGQRTKRWR